RHDAIDPSICALEQGARLASAKSIAIFGRSDVIEDDLLHRRHDVVVEHAIHKADFNHRVGIGRDEAHGPRMAEAEILDDDRALFYRAIAVDQNRHAHHWPKRSKLASYLVVAWRQQSQLECRAVFVERGENLLAVGRKRMGVELQRHWASTG